MTLNIVFFMISPGGLAIFLVTHISVGSGPWVLPLIFCFVYVEIIEGNAQRQKLGCV